MGDAAMRDIRIAFALALAASAALSASAGAEDRVTVQSLIRQDFQVVASVFNPATGANVFLQKKDALYFCALTETANSPDRPPLVTSAS